MFRHIKSSCLALSIFILLLLASNVSFAVGIPNLTGTWDVKLKVKFYNLYWAGQPTSDLFDDTATMKITHHDYGVLQIEIDGTTNWLIDGMTPTPDFYGRGIVGSFLMGTEDHLVAIHCPSDVDYGQQIVVHKIWHNNKGSAVAPNKMKGTWMIVNNSGNALDSSAVGIIATFTATKISTDDPNVSTCD